MLQNASINLLKFVYLIILIECSKRSPEMILLVIIHESWLIILWLITSHWILLWKPSLVDLLILSILRSNRIRISRIFNLSFAWASFVSLNKEVEIWGLLWTRGRGTRTEAQEPSYRSSSFSIGIANSDFIFATNDWMLTSLVSLKNGSTITEFSF